MYLKMVRLGEQGVLDISKINGFDERKDCQAQPEKEWNVVMWRVFAMVGMRMNKRQYRGCKARKCPMCGCEARRISRQRDYGRNKSFRESIWQS